MVKAGKIASIMAFILLLVLFLYNNGKESKIVEKYYGYIASIYAEVLIKLANNDRVLSGKRVLTESPLLNIAAQNKVNDMARRSYFSHDTPEGKTPWQWIDETGYRYSFAGENLALNFPDSDSAHRAWLNSPLHRANILNQNFTEIGIATATGFYLGKEVVFIVEIFATLR